MPEIPVPCVCLVIMGWRSAGRPSRHASHQMRSTSVERAPPGGAHKLTSSGELEELFRGPDQARHARPCESFDGGDAKEGRYPPSRPCITRQYRVLKAVLWAFKRETWCLGLARGRWIHTRASTPRCGWETELREIREDCQVLRHRSGWLAPHPVALFLPRSRAMCLSGVGKPSFELFPSCPVLCFLEPLTPDP